MGEENTRRLSQVFDPLSRLGELTRLSHSTPSSPRLLPRRVREAAAHAGISASPPLAAFDVLEAAARGSGPSVPADGNAVNWQERCLELQLELHRSRTQATRTRDMLREKEDACKRCFEEVIDNLCIVFDLKDFGIGCMDYQLIKNLIWLLSKHYPERLGVCLIINSSPLFSSCWLVIKGWLDENTTSKVTFVNSEEELCKYLIPDVLPTDI